MQSWPIPSCIVIPLCASCVPVLDLLCYVFEFLVYIPVFVTL